MSALHVTVPQLRNGNGNGNGHRREVAAYDYTDERGALLYQAVRMEPKDFRCRRPDGRGGWIWNLTGVRVVPYRLTDLAEARRVYVVEGEQDTDTLAAAGLTATTNHGGAGKWRDAHTKALVAAAVPEVIVLRDNDEPGERHAASVAAACHAAGLRVKRVLLPGLPPLRDKHGEDVTDWLNAGHAIAELDALADAAPALGVFTNGHRSGATVEAEETVDNIHSSPAPVGPYTFAAAFPPEHFVSQFLAYGTQCVDCAHDYLETVALVALATATPDLRARLRQYPRGLGTAFYAILIGDSTRSRKSTAAALGLDILNDAAPESQLAEQASPEAFVEQVAARSHDSTLWYVDELGETLDKLHHAKYMAGLRGLLLSLYDGRRYTYRRTTKRTKKGEPVEDALVIEHPNLAVLGATTEAIFEIVTARDVSSGFMARFAVVMPTSRPPRRGLEESPKDLTQQRQDLAAWLTRLCLWAKTGPRSVRFIGNALGIIDAFAEAIETSAALSNERARAMLQRLNAMTVKLSMLAAAGRPDADARDDLQITPEDAQAAVAVATRWRDYAVAFGERVGETALEQKIDRALTIVQAKKRVARRVVAQLVHCSKKVMDDIEATLEDRGAIVVEQVEGKSGPAARIWTWVAP
jgi:5S rRNA maturation endonuclease (ribonuclease M5)